MSFAAQIYLWAAEKTDSVPLEAVFAGAGAVVIAAVIALVGVYLQTTKTLKAERERLDDQLSAERERLQMQLAHDRETKEREDLRKVLDSAAVALDDTAIAAIDATTACEAVLEQEPSADDSKDARDLTELEKEFFAELELLFSCLRKVDVHTTQIAMRLGTDHPIKALYRGSREQFALLHRSLIDLEIDSEGEGLVKAGQAKRKFEAAAADLIGSDLN